MATPPNQNPYRTPESSAGESTPAPSVLASTVIVLLTVFAGVCTFFVTCFGAAFVGASVLGAFGLFVGMIVAIVATIYSTRGIYAGLNRLFAPAKDNHSPEKQAAADTEFDDKNE